VWTPMQRPSSTSFIDLPTYTLVLETTPYLTLPLSFKKHLLLIPNWRFGRYNCPILGGIRQNHQRSIQILYTSNKYTIIATSGALGCIIIIGGVESSSMSWSWFTWPNSGYSRAKTKLSRTITYKLCRKWLRTYALASPLNSSATIPREQDADVFQQCQDVFCSCSRLRLLVVESGFLKTCTIGLYSYLALSAARWAFLRLY